MLQYNEVLSYATLSDFDLLKHSRHDVLARPWSNTMHRQMAVKYFKLLRAHEEINRLNVEIRRLQAWVDNETTEIKRIATEISAQNSVPCSIVNNGSIFNINCGYNVYMTSRDIWECGQL